MNPKEEHRLYQENLNLRIAKDKWKDAKLSTDKRLAKVKEERDTALENYQEELKKA